MATQIDYHTYMMSERWRLKRGLVLRRDGFQCRVCTSTQHLEVHHRHYRNLGDESLDDLITLCHKHHEAITKVDNMHKKPRKKTSAKPPRPLSQQLGI